MAPAFAAPAPAPLPPSPASATSSGSDDVKPSANQSMVTSLREIGRVRATTHFCSTLRHSSEQAANAAVAFEVAALATMTDLLAFASPPNQLAKARLERSVDDDLRNLADLSRAGGAELDELRVLAKTATPAQSAALLGLRDALDGAKSRQHYMTKEIARMAGEAAEVRPFALIDTDPGNFIARLSGTPYARHEATGPAYGGVLDGHYGEGLDTLPSDLLGGGSDYGSILDAGDHFAVLLPDDDRVRDDLATAAGHATVALDLGKCSSDPALTNPALPATDGGAPPVPAPTAASFQ